MHVQLPKIHNHTRKCSQESSWLSPAKETSLTFQTNESRHLVARDGWRTVLQRKQKDTCLSCVALAYRDPPEISR